MTNHNRRQFMLKSTLCLGGISLGLATCTKRDIEVLAGVKDFIYNTANKDGSFRPGVDLNYQGNSDTALSGMAAPAYATIISETFGWTLPYPDATIDFLLSCQKEDGSFYPPTGSMDHDTPLARLYNTVQGVVALRLLGSQPRYDTMPVISWFFKEDEFTELPLYTTSFFPLYFTAMGKTMPDHIDKRMREYILNEQTDDGYLRDHVANTFHAAHYFRMIGEPTPRAEVMVDRVLKDQKEDGSWSLWEPDWDVHACFDALFILRQLGTADDPRIITAYQKAIDWILTCRKKDGGFSHFPEGATSDMDAVYFHVGALVEAGYLQMKQNIENEEILGWGHAMNPRKTYSCLLPRS